MTDTRQRISAGRIEDWEPGEVRRLDTEPPVAIYNVDGRFFATSDWCSHDRASLSEGWLEGDVIECPWHMAKFCVRTGRALSAPAKEDIRCFSISEEDGELFVDLGEAT